MHICRTRRVRGSDRRAAFDLNDFDETLPAPFEWDVKRLVASFVVAACGNGHRRKAQRAAARAAAAAYRTTIAKAATRASRDVWYRRFDVEKLIADYAPTTDKAAVKSARKALLRRRRRGRASAPCRSSRSGSMAATGSSSSRR